MYQARRQLFHIPAINIRYLLVYGLSDTFSNQTMQLKRSDGMTVNQYIEQLSRREVIYVRRVQYSLIFMVLAILPLITFSSETGRFYLKSFGVLIRQFGDIGISMLLTFMIIMTMIGVSSLWKLYKTARLKSRYRWGAYSAR